ncbi:cysteine hydrolase family protein [Marininema halotolerans]|uniref:Nicotinamidase-related amidase n=1 Tax=Marininema halotolerans TaxID=1155944 RepID=A0A1I6PCH4_9BACL|nr:isochorismatase family cysteine hydrolase [Marininema halotolerans]SFS37795.1 Nicotinamidase-related amidase [Marininema halotolerans]
MKVALLIVDMQKEFLEEQKEALQVAAACEYINHVANTLRGKEHLVVHIQDVEGRAQTDFDREDVVSEIKVDSADLLITKEYSNAFWKTELEQYLLEKEVHFVIVAGFAAEYCVLFTYNGAMERGFNPVILQNGIISTKRESVDQTYRDRHVLSYTAIDYMMR